MSREPHLMNKKDLALALRHLPAEVLEMLDDAIDDATEADEFGKGPDRMGVNARRTLACLSFAIADVRKDVKA